MLLKTLVLIIGIVIFLNLASLTIMLVINIREIRKVKDYLREEQEEREIEQKLDEYEDIEVL